MAKRKQRDRDGASSSSAKPGVNNDEAGDVIQRDQNLSLIREIREYVLKIEKDHLQRINDISELEERLGKGQVCISELQARLLEADELQKRLQHKISELQELKGNVKVFCRVRPLIPHDGPTAETCISYPTSLGLAGQSIDLYQSGGKHSFTFDKVFAPDASQQEVFTEISQLVQSVLEGYKVCIFAYGQTGSGKTYTMMGRPEDSVQKGLIPRSLEQVFQTSQALAVQGWKYKMQASMLEIHNETIRDLLLVHNLLPQSSGGDGGSGEGKQYVISHDIDGNTSVSDLTIVDVRNIREAFNLLKQAAHSRSVGKTDMKEHSISHFVFTLRIYGVNESTEQEVQGVLNLIDLAGSGASGDRSMETQAIDKNLSSLSDVVNALVKKEDHVPFRKSRLTYLLQPCLGSGSKTLMFVNVSPDPSSFGESLCSLRFAARVNSCEIGMPRRQTILDKI